MMKLAVVVAEYLGANLVRLFQRLGVLERICDFSLPRLKRLAAKYPHVRVEASYQEKLQLYDKRINPVKGQFVVERPTPEAVDSIADEQLMIECPHAECVGTRRSAPTDYHDTWRVLRAMEASRRRMNREPVQLEAAPRRLEVVRA